MDASSSLEKCYAGVKWDGVLLQRGTVSSNLRDTLQRMCWNADQGIVCLRVILHIAFIGVVSFIFTCLLKLPARPGEMTNFLVEWMKWKSGGPSWWNLEGFFLLETIHCIWLTFVNAIGVFPPSPPLIFRTVLLRGRKTHRRGGLLLTLFFACQS